MESIFIYLSMQIYLYIYFNMMNNAITFETIMQF